MVKQNSKELSLLWYDYETWGANPQRDHIAQFAAIRTDLDLNPISDPIDILCKPSIDTVIDPEAVTITGLSPLKLTETGLNEWDFAQQIHTHMSLSGTCTTGYNTIRFDDECTRYLFYRNLIDPYAREWKNGNSRWDILDVVRMTHALRPEGIKWPVHENGSPSFKLEHLTKANGVAHENAHDAVSDVKATIAIAKLIKDHQPKLFDYAFALRSKHEVRKHIDVEGRRPHLHFTGKIPAIEHCMGIEVPLMVHPDRANEIIVIDIREDPSWVLDHSADQLREWLYSKTEDMPEGISRPPFKTIHINRSPMVAPMSLLDDEAANRLGVEIELINAHRNTVDQHPEILKLALDVFTSTQEYAIPEDNEHALYSGFIDDHDRNLLNKMAAGKIAKENWLNESHLLHDNRLPDIIYNVLARNFPDSLTQAQLDQWYQKRQPALISTTMGQAISLEDAIAKATQLISDFPENLALVDTKTYLSGLLEHWFVTKQSNKPAIIEPELATDEVPSVANEQHDINDQMDLF